MSKVALITDIHFGCRGASSYFIERYELFFKNIFFPYLVKNGIRKVFILGDTWEDRKNLNVNALAAARRMFFERLEQMGIEVIAILGNHDVFYRNTNEVNSMDIIESSYDNIHVVEEYEEFKVGQKTFGMMSWVNNSNLERNLARIEAANTNYLLGHFEIKNFEMTKGNVADKGFEPSIFTKYDLVLSGHFHIKNKIGNILYIGNPFQTNWDDFASDRGFHVYDSDTDEFIFIKNTYETYDVIAYTDEFDLDTFDFEACKGKIVKVLVTKISEIDQLKYNKFLDILLKQVHEYSIVEVVDSSELQGKSNNLTIKSSKEMINEYINSLTVEDDVKKDVISILHDLHNVVLSLKMTEN